MARLKVKVLFDATKLIVIPLLSCPSELPGLAAGQCIHHERDMKKLVYLDRQACYKHACQTMFRYPHQIILLISTLLPGIHPWIHLAAGTMLQIVCTPQINLLQRQCVTHSLSNLHLISALHSVAG